MYEDLMGMDGLGEFSLESIKREGAEYGVLAVSTLASIAVAKMVGDWVSTQSWALAGLGQSDAPPATDKAGETPPPAGKSSSPSMIGKIAVPGVPIAAGLAIGIYGRSSLSGMAQKATDGVALGMIAYGIANVAARFIDAKKFNFAGVAGLGQSKDLSISSYLGQAPSMIETSMRGIGQAYNPFSARAQMGLAQAPSMIETSLRGLGQAPSSIEVEQRQLAGLAATLM